VTGTTSFSWTASKPSPSSSCDGYTPVSSLTITGTIANKGNDTTASATWKNSSGLSGSDALESNLVLTPTNEILQSGGWGVNNPTKLNIIQTLQDTESYDPGDPHSNEFQGRQVYETASGSGTDGCYNAAKGTSPYAPFSAVTGGTWNVGYTAGYTGDTYGYDTVGYPQNEVDWY